VQQIGRYQILDEIGRGAMGVVYRAQDPAIGRIIAIKTIRLTDLTDTTERERLRDRLFREAQSAGILSHPNIVTIYDIAEENGQACIFMEYVNGPPLERLLASKEPPGKQTFLNIFQQTAAGLDYAHRKGIVHRDIKPANILIHEDGHAKITDFGVAKILSQQMTHSGGMMGTPNYMSPEQVQGLAVDGRADQFGLAVIAYELLTGEKPFTGEYLPTLLYKIVREDPIPPQRINSSLSPAFETVLFKALSKDPQARYATCADFVKALIQACESTPTWTPLPRGASHSMPTMAGHAAPVPGAAKGIAGRPDAAAALAARRAQRDSGSDHNPLIRSLVWVLVGIGLVGLVLLGAQKFLFNPPVAPPPEPTQTAVVDKPSPMPNLAPAMPLPGDADAAAQPVADAAKPEPAKAEPAKPEPPKPEAAKREADKPEVKEEARIASPPVKPEPVAPTMTEPSARPKTEGERSLQLLTDPPGALVTVDGRESTSCRTPCILSVPQGRHTLTTQLEGYRPYPRIFNIPGESDLFLKLAKARGTLSITSTPPGATIQINGDQKPQATPATFVVPPGSYHVRVTRNGVPLDFDVQVQDDEIQTRNVNFP
jgi:serine/threonine-protein kinase